MRKLTLCLALTLLFGTGLLVGLGATNADAGSCYYTCRCDGVPLKCCTSPFGTSCKVAKDSPLQCTQGMNC